MRGLEFMFVAFDRRTRHLTTLSMDEEVSSIRVGFGFLPWVTRFLRITFNVAVSEVGKLMVSFQSKRQQSSFS